MQSTQVTCPHCGSTLTFGAKIAAGTAVECLICMRGFTATNPVAVPVAVAAGPAPQTASSAKPKPNAEKIKPAAAKPYGSPTAPKPTKAGKPTPAPTVRRPEEPGSNVALIAVAIVLLLGVTGGIGYAVWRATSSTRMGDPDEPKIVKIDPPIDPKGKKIDPIVDKNPANGGGKPLATNDDDDDDIRAKFQEEIKQVLKRRIPSKIGAKEPEFDPINTPDVPNVVIAGLDQNKINSAIDRGILNLKKTQNAMGTWPGGHDVGRASLGGLTLLECKVPADDPTIQRAAALVRANAASLDQNYELSLAVLFLDRLGDPRDRPIIQGLALRLMAGQNDAGAWTYNAKAGPPGIPDRPTNLSPQEMYQLYGYMRPKNHLFKPVANPKIVNPIVANDPFLQLNQMLLADAAPAIQLDALSPELRKLPVVLNKGKRKGEITVAGQGGLGDNSNTQFALMALWAARRHGLPTDPSLLAGYQRFCLSQSGDHGWGYGGGPSTNTMTCVGLIGLGIGHGTSPEISGIDPDDPKAVIVKPALQDVRIQNGLKALARNIGHPSPDAKKTSFPMENLYFLWSVERVAMLYDLKTIGGKDWYGWGAQILVHNQRPDGGWQGLDYSGSNPSIDTCFALLFLRRSNLVQDLTRNLRLNTGIRDPE